MLRRSLLAACAGLLLSVAFEPVAAAWVIPVAVAGFLVGYALWNLGYELIGSAVSLVGAGLGGILAFFGDLNWSERRRG